MLHILCTQFLMKGKVRDEESLFQLLQKRLFQNNKFVSFDKSLNASRKGFKFFPHGCPKCTLFFISINMNLEIT